MITYFILSLLGICTHLHANGGIPLITKWLQSTVFLHKISGLPFGSNTHYLLTAILVLFLLVLTICIEYFVFVKVIKSASHKLTLRALIVANVTSGIVGSIILVGIFDLIVGFTAQFIPSMKYVSDYGFKILLEWSTNMDAKLFINDPMQVLSWLVFFLIVNLIIEAPIIASIFQKIPFKRILFVTFVANLASNVAFLVLLKAATLIWS